MYLCTTNDLIPLVGANSIDNYNETIAPMKEVEAKSNLDFDYQRVSYLSLQFHVVLISYILYKY